MQWAGERFALEAGTVCSAEIAALKSLAGWMKLQEMREVHGAFWFELSGAKKKKDHTSKVTADAM